MMAPPKQNHESLSEEPDSDGGGASDFILKAISPSKRRPSSIPGVSGPKKKKKKKVAAAAAVAAAATEADEHIAVSADAGNVGVGVTKTKKNKSAVVQVVQKGVNKDGDETLKAKISGGEMIPPSGGGGRGGGAVALEEDDAGQSGSRKRNKKMSNRSNKENNKEKAKQKKIKEKRKDEEKISGDEMMIPPNGAEKEEGEDNTGDRKESKNSKRAEPARETEEKEKQECRSEEEIRGNLSSAEDTNNAVNMTIEVGKEKENEEDQEGKELNCDMEDFWCHHPNLKESMETGMFGPMPLAGKWLSSNTVGREKAKELEQKWMSLQKAETELFHERMVLIKEEIGGVLSTVADP